MTDYVIGAQIVKEEDQQVLLRTLLRKDIFIWLSDGAKKYATGQGKWDYGVFLQVLKEKIDIFEKDVVVADLLNHISELSEKIDELQLQVSSLKKPEVPVEDKSIEMLGGYKIKV
jgi:hypothetical protein